MDTRAEVVRTIVRFELPALGPVSIRLLGEGRGHAAYDVDRRYVVRFAIDGDDHCAARCFGGTACGIALEQRPGTISRCGPSQSVHS